MSEQKHGGPTSNIRAFRLLHLAAAAGGAGEAEAVALGFPASITRDRVRPSSGGAHTRDSSLQMSNQLMCI
jgi:hypothetical protein